MITKKIEYRTYIASMIIVLLSQIICAQKSITLADAKNLAKEKNFDLKTQNLNVLYQSKNINTAYTMDPTQIDSEFGQFNSTYFDIAVGISQSFHLPQVYQRKKDINKQKVKVSEAYMNATEVDVHRQITEIFINYHFLEAKTKLLVEQDSLFGIFQRIATDRYQSGETDALAKISAEQQKMSITNELISLQNEKDILVFELNWLLGNVGNFIPESEDFTKIPSMYVYDVTAISRHPLLLAALQENETSILATQIEKSVRLPKFSLGYNNISIRGTGPDNIIYQSGDRFHSFQFGMAIPILNKGNNAAIQAAKIMEEVTNQQLLSKKAALEYSVNQKNAMIQNLYKRLDRYATFSLPNAARLQSIAEIQYSSGDINYLEFVLLNQQAIAIKKEYLQLIHELKITDIQLKYLTSNL
ncbi:MAG: TolC family protein [Saprospiraceae bacterium]